MNKMKEIQGEIITDNSIEPDIFIFPDPTKPTIFYIFLNYKMPQYEPPEFRPPEPPAMRDIFFILNMELFDE